MDVLKVTVNVHAEACLPRHGSKATRYISKSCARDRAYGARQDPIPDSLGQGHLPNHQLFVGEPGAQNDVCRAVLDGLDQIRDVSSPKLPIGVHAHYYVGTCLESCADA
jgi:hypothetical protein